MVLSNKKLKQKLRAALAESLAASVAGTADPITTDSISTNPDNPSSLKNLLDSGTQVFRLSKREKRRKTLFLQGPDPEGTENHREEKEASAEALTDDGNDTEKTNKKRKKRKRDGELEDGELGLEENKNKKLKKKKKKKSKKKKKPKSEGQNKGNENGGEREVAKEAVQISDSQQNGDAFNKVYVGGIPFYSTEDDIRSFFDSCGTITEVDCMTFPESGKFRGIAIIRFKTEAAAKRALALDGADMGGLFLKIQPYKSIRANKSSDFAPEMVEGYNRIYVGNLSWDITEDDLRKFFSGCKVSSIRFGQDKETQEFRGYAHVDFSDNNSLTMALKLDQEIVCGRPAKISCAVPKKGTKKDYPPPPPSSEKAVNDGGLPSGSGSVKAVNDGELPSGSGNVKAVSDSGFPSDSRNEESVNDAGLTSGSGKMKRRTCYECGERGHISSACPKRQMPDLKNSSSS